MVRIVNIEGVRIAGINSCLPARIEDNLSRCTEVYGSEKKATNIIRATGIKSRRVVDAGTSSLDLCTCAAKELIRRLDLRGEDFSAVIDVTFTPERIMPCNACRIQDRLGLRTDIIAFDINLACSGWAYGLFVAGQLAKATNAKVLLLDGDTQTPYTDRNDASTVPVMADAGTATVVEPMEGASAWTFSFLTEGGKGDALTLPFGGKISMDGLGIFKFVTMDVLYFLRDFLATVGVTTRDVAAFVPHQANVFMIQQIAKKLGFDSTKLMISGDTLGNSSSATVPTTIAYAQCRGKLLVSGFGGGCQHLLV